jgi:hypothetical protein
VLFLARIPKIFLEPIGNDFGVVAESTFIATNVVAVPKGDDQIQAVS